MQELGLTGEKGEGKGSAAKLKAKVPKCTWMEGKAVLGRVLTAVRPGVPYWGSGKQEFILLLYMNKVTLKAFVLPSSVFPLQGTNLKSAKDCNTQRLILSAKKWATITWVRPWPAGDQVFQDSHLLVAQLVWSSRIVSHKKTLKNYIEGCIGNVCI